MSGIIPTTHPRRSPFRARLMAGAAIMGALGFALPLLYDLNPVPAYADTQGVAQSMPSFADIVEKVRPAVVSVKVKVEKNVSQF